MLSQYLICEKGRYAYNECHFLYKILAFLAYIFLRRLQNKFDRQVHGKEVTSLLKFA